MISACVLNIFSILIQGGTSTGYKKFVSENNIEDDTYSESGVALFRVQGSGPENMQAIQVDTVLCFYCLFNIAFYCLFINALGLCYGHDILVDFVNVMTIL